MGLEFHQLVAFKNYLKRFFSAQPWTDEDATGLADLVGDGEGWWEHQLGPFTMAHGWEAGRYRLTVTGTPTEDGRGLFDRVFSGPVIPEPTPHPRKVKFTTGGTPAPGVWYLHGDTPDDPRAAALLEEPGVTDVMVAGHFVTVGLDRTASWEQRLDGMIERITELFWTGAPNEGGTDFSRDEMIAEAGTGLTVDELHLMDPDDPSSRQRLLEALIADDPRLRRVAVAVAAESTDSEFAAETLRAAYSDRSKVVRRTAIDAAGDRADDSLRPLFEKAATDPDPWTRWRSLRALRTIGAEPSRATVEALTGDPDFQVRFEAEAARRELTD